jgi:hypothetical protein
MNWKKWLKLFAQVAVVVGLLYCICNVSRQKNMINDLKERDVAQTELIKDQSKAIVGLVEKLGEVSEAFGNQKIVNDHLLAEINTLKGVEPTDLTSVEDRVDSILSQIEQLDKDKITEADFDKWVQDVEKLVNNSLVELSKPPTVPPVKPMPNITPQPPKVALSNQERAEIVKRVKKEIFKQFEQAGYGKFEGDRFVLKEGFFGARIYPGDLEKHHPVAPYVDDFKYGTSN